MGNDNRFELSNQINDGFHNRREKYFSLIIIKREHLKNQLKLVN